ncbi:hypothetical protein V6373_16350, partial [Acinetobacter baumannii]
MKVVLKRSILILFLTGNIIGLSYAQAAELEPVKLKKSCIKKNPLAEGQNDPELLNIFKQVCDSDNTTQKNDLLAKAAMRFYQTNQPVKALNLASQLQRALLHKDLKVKTSHIYSNLSDNSGMW